MDDSRHLAIYLPLLIEGGAEHAILRLVNAIVARDYRVDLVLSKAAGPYLSRVDPRVRVVDLRSHRAAASLPGFVRYLRRERPEALLSGTTHGSVVALLAKRLGRSKARIVLRAGSSSLPRRFSIRGLLVRWLFPRSDSVICNSQGVAELIHTEGGVPVRKIHVIHNPVVSDELRSLARKPADHRWLQSREGATVVSVGRLFPEKDYPTLIKAFEIVNERHPAHLVVFGEGPERQALELEVDQRGLSDRVAFPGFVSNPYADVARADVFVLSSKREGSPNALIEALFLGVPLVATDCPTGPREILEGGKYGQLVPVGDSEAMADAILDAIKSGRNAPYPEESWRRFEIEGVVDAYLAQLLPD